MLNRQIEKMLTEKLGHPNRVTKKVSAWSLNSNTDIVLETNYESTKSQFLANLWLPALYANKCDCFNAINYPEGKGRHSNTYPSNGLERNKAAIKVKIINLPDTERLLTSLR